jgi:hypothetical protein
MRKSICFALPLALVVAEPALAWQRFIGGGPNWVQSLAPRSALSTDPLGNVCLLTNDRVYGAITNAHVLGLEPMLGDVHPWMVLHAERGFSTFGVDCSSGRPIAAYTALDPMPERHTVLTGIFDDGVVQWRTDLLSMGAVRPARFITSAMNRTLVLREKVGASAWDVQAYDGFQPYPTWQAMLDAWRWPAARVLDMRFADDGSSALLGTYDVAGSPGVGVFVQRFDANGNPQFPNDFPDGWQGEVTAAALGADGTAYYVRRDTQFLQDTLTRVPAPFGPPQGMDLGCCAPSEVVQVTALVDSGLLVAVRNAYASPQLRRYAADGTLAWQADAYEFGPPGFELLAMIGDRNGRALTVSAEPAFGGLPNRRIRLRAYDAQGIELWSFWKDNARFDEGNPARLALTSDDHVVFALNATDAASPSPGIFVQSFTLDTMPPPQ